MSDDVIEPIDGSQGGADSDDLLDESGYLPLKVRRRYAKAKSTFEAGVYYAEDVSLLMGIMIGSMAGVRNTYSELRQDNEDLRKRLRKLGLDYADCGCAELSPDSHEFVKRDGTIGRTVGNLWHIHAIWRFAEFIKAGELHSVLSPLWGKKHGSDVVDVKVLPSVEKAIKYAVKDAVKHYCSEDHNGKRLFVSRNWLPPMCREVEKVLNHWALFHGANWKPDDDLDEFAGGQYIAYAWDIRNEYFRRWCSGGTVWLNMGDYHVYIDGERIIRSDRKVAIG